MERYHKLMRDMLVKAGAVPPEYITNRLGLESAEIQRLTDDVRRQQELMRAVATPPEYMTSRLGLESAEIQRLTDDVRRQQELAGAITRPAGYMTTGLGLESAAINRPTDEMNHQQELARAFALPPEYTLGLDSAAFRRLTDEIKRQQELARAALGPLEDLKRLTAAHAPFSEAVSKALTDYADRFRVPALAEIEPLWQKFKASEAAFSRFHLLDDSLQHAVAAMRTPWLDAENPLRSIAGFAGVQEIGYQLHQHPAFDASITDVLRSSLGDWRSAIEFPKDIFDDIPARTALYLNRGLNPDLTAFPAKAFKQSLWIAGLNDAPPLRSARYSTDADTETSDEEAGFRRTNAAHDRLIRFETQLRRFIDRRMKTAFGEQWDRHRVPGDIRERWEQKKQIARDNGEQDRLLITYADFTDYVVIITRRDNWSDVFASVFGRVESVRESFQRLYPIRLCTMHARIITQDDELYLHVETLRLLKAMGIL